MIYGTIISLPCLKVLRVKGGLDLSFNKFTSLPEGLRVKGGLDLSSNKLTSLPEDLEVAGNLDLRRNSFPDYYKISDTVKIGDEVLI